MKKFVLQKSEGITTTFIPKGKTTVELIYCNIWSFGIVPDKKKIVDISTARELWRKLLKKGYKRIA